MDRRSSEMRRCCFALLCCFAGVVLAADSKQAEKPFKDGLRYEQNSQWKEAEASYSEAIHLNPDSALYYLHRARVRASNGDAPHALEDATSASQLEPTNGEAFELLGNIDVQLSNSRQAVTDYTHAIELGVNTAAVYNARRRGPYQLGRVRLGAVADYTAGIKLRLDDPEPIRLRGDVYVALGHYSDGIDDFDQSISLKPDNPDAFLGRGFCRGQFGDYRRAHPGFR